MRFLNGLCVFTVIAFAGVVSNASGQSVIQGKQAFLSQLGGSATVIDFEDQRGEALLPPGAYQPLGVTIEQLDGFPLYVGEWQFPSQPALIVPSGTKAISSSFAGTSHGGTFAPVCEFQGCHLYWNNGASDHLRITFDPPVFAAGIHLGQNDNVGITVTWHERNGRVIKSQYFAAQQPLSGLVGLISEVPIGSMVLTNGANDNDAMYFDDLIFARAGVVASAGADFSVDEGQSGVTLDGTGTANPSGGALTYSWVQLSGGSTVTLSGANTAHPSFTAPYVAFGGETLTFELTVIASGVTSTDVVSVTIVNVNHAPVADAGPSQTVAEGSPVVLHGEASFDLDGDDFSYAWQQVGGTSVVPLGGANTKTPTFTAPYVASGGAPGVVATLIFELRVDDGQPPEAAAPGFTLENVADRISVDITNVNNVPAANAGSDQTVDENAAVTLNAASSNDPDSDLLTYEWAQLGGPAIALSDASTVAPTFAAPYVASGGADLTFAVTASDGYGGWSSDTVVVHVQNVNDPPLANAARPSVGVLWPPNHTLVKVAIVGVTDPNNDAVITITGVTQDEPADGLGDGDTAVDAIIGSDGTVLLRAERAGGGDGRVYRVRFVASDAEGASTGEVLVSVPHSSKKTAIEGSQSFDSTH